jgi:hypothetical protein
MRHVLSSLLISLGLAGVGSAAMAQTFTVGFENLQDPPALDGAGQLRYANGTSDLYEGIVWDQAFSVIGSQYRTNGDPSNPLHGVPHTGNFYVTNEGTSGGSGGDGIMITTSHVLLGAWFGRNEYYGFGAGTHHITIHALAGSTELGAPVAFDLPAPAQPGQPGVLAYVDTSAFAQLSGITGYRIDRSLLPGQGGGWVADDFVFASAVPEPEQAVLLLAGLGVLALARRRRQLSAAA